MMMMQELWNRSNEDDAVVIAARNRGLLHECIRASAC
jgi:hypothetical protein